MPELVSSADDDFVVVHGVADLAVILPAAIWLVDFKTDQFPARELADKTAAYAPQLQLYAFALSRIYRRPVTERWLHFLSAGQTVGEHPPRYLGGYQPSP